MNSPGWTFAAPHGVVRWLIIANVVTYVVELVAIRMGLPVIEYLALSPADVFSSGLVWQLLTSTFLHDPGRPFHLLFNMLWLWWAGQTMLRVWGATRFLRGYLFFAVCGGLFVLLMGMLSQLESMHWILSGFWTRKHLGASGATMGLLVAWGLYEGTRSMMLPLVGVIRVRTFLFAIVGIELLFALSFEPVSSASHFGGMIGAFVLCRGAWRPAYWIKWVRGIRMRRSRKKIEHELKVLEGGLFGGSEPRKRDKNRWN